jgi:hypothetical protein
MAGQLGILDQFGQSGLLRAERGGAKPPAHGGAPRTTGARKRSRSRSRKGSGSTSGRHAR